MRKATGDPGRGPTGGAVAKGATPAPAKPAPAATDPKSLFLTKCSLCHSVSRPEGKRMTKDDWTKTVQAMQQKK